MFRNLSNDWCIWCPLTNEKTVYYLISVLLARWLRPWQDCYEGHFDSQMAFSRSRLLTQLFSLIPGKERLGIYRIIPVFFLAGAGLEFCMINWTVGETNFCRFPCSDATILLALIMCICSSFDQGFIYLTPCFYVSVYQTYKEVVGLKKKKETVYNNYELYVTCDKSC